MSNIKHPAAATLREWARKTHNNDHDAVRVQIANWIKLNTKICAADCLCVYKEIEARHNLEGNLSTLDSFARCGADSVLLGRIRAADDYLAEEIAACL